MKNKAFPFWTLHGPAFTPTKLRRRIKSGSLQTRLLRFITSRKSKAQ